jgi:hypothetical protein
MTDKNKWVACWGNATSITNRREAIYAKDLGRNGDWLHCAPEIAILLASLW